MNTHATKPAVLILGNYRPCLPLARELHQAGYRVVITAGCSGERCEYSRYVDECWDHPPLENTQAFFAALAAFLESRGDIEVVYPVWEICLSGLIDNFDHMPTDRLYAMANKATVQLSLDKGRMLDRIKSLGLPNATAVAVGDYGELTRTVESEIGYPAIIRPVSSKHRIDGKKAVILRSREDRELFLPTWPERCGDLIVQRYVEGPRLNVYFAANQGQPIRYQASQIFKTDVSDGTGFAVHGQTIAMNHQLTGVCDTILRDMKYHGIGLMQFIEDEASGAPVFLELNPRVSGSHAIPEHCGMELSILGIELARDDAVSHPVRFGDSSKTYVWTYGELSGIARSLKGREIGLGRAAIDGIKCIWRALTASVDMTGQLTDPLPCLALFARKLSVANAALKPFRARKSKSFPIVLPSPNNSETPL